MTDGEGSGGPHLAERILARREEVARAATEEFLERHPGWLEDYGEGARRHGVEDAGYHVDFLAGALAADSVESFRRYAAWAARVLSRRGIEPHFLAESLEQVGRHVAGPLAPEEAARVRTTVEAGVRACRAASERPDAPATARHETLDLYLEVALRGDRNTALTIVREALREGMSPRELYLDVLQEAQYEVGRRWADNEITVAQEHTATMVCQYVLVRLYDDLPRPEHRRGRAVVTGVEGELHQVGANMVADTLEMDGWEVRFLGTQMPHRGIVDAAGEMEADLVCVSVTMLFNLPRLRDLVERLRNGRGERTPRILVGGGVFRADPGAWRTVGADGYGADLVEAVREARSLAGGSREEG